MTGKQSRKASSWPLPGKPHVKTHELVLREPTSSPFGADLFSFVYGGWLARLTLNQDSSTYAISVNGDVLDLTACLEGDDLDELNNLSQSGAHIDDDGEWNPDFVLLVQMALDKYLGIVRLS